MRTPYFEEKPIKNRLKKNESTFCTYTESGREIIEGHILGYGDNYPCVVLYNKWEAKFDTVEFGYEDEHTTPFRTHDVLAYTVKWEILGHIDTDPHILQPIPNNFDYNKYIEKYYL
jgi:hypothetical protein